MKKLLVICLSLALLASIGCGNNTQNDENSTTTRDISADKVSSTEDVSPPEGTARPGGTAPPANIPKRPYIDPVDGSIIKNVAAAKDSCFHMGIKLYFSSKKNCEEFKQDPEKFSGRIPKI